jgi:hypothetical protein
MRENWKFWLAVLMVALAAGFGVMRFRRLVHEQAPAWLKLEHKAAESLPKPAWEHFKLVVKQTQTEADTRGLPFGSIQFVDLNDRTNEATWWTTERVVNQGFNPLTSLESSSQAGKDRFLGYYTLGGDSLSCEIKHHPSRPNWLILTVNLEQPLPPGASLVVVRVERRPGTLTTTRDGKSVMNFGRLAKAATGVQARAILLPGKSVLAQYRPEKGASVFHQDGEATVLWINTRLDDAQPPLSATFTMAK